MSELSHGQQIVLNHFFTVYPEDATFPQMCLMLEENSDEIGLWEPYEEWDTQYLIKHITGIANDIDTVIVDSHKEPEVTLNALVL